MKIQLSDHFTYPKLLRFVAPSIVMMIFTSIYSVVDGLFVSRYVGKTSFAAINLIMPALMILQSVGLMIGTGGTAIVGKTLGEGDREKANSYFSMLVYVLFGVGLVFAIIGFFAMRPLAVMLKADGNLLENCVLYGKIVMVAMPFEILLMSFSSFFVTAEKPDLGLGVSVFAGVTNMILDALFILGFKWGLSGAALATSLSQILGAAICLIYFARKNTSLLKLTTHTRLYGKVLLKACTNGASEMVSNIASSIIGILYNYQLMRYAGEDGVSAYGVIMYISMIFAAIFFGYSMGSGPVVSFQFGAGNHKELKNMFRKSMVFNLIAGIVMVLFVIVMASPFSKLFVGYDEGLYHMTVHAFHIYAPTFLLMGFAVFGSGFFTALNDGKVSAIISFLKTFGFEVLSILILPQLFHLEGVWWAAVTAEVGAFLVSVSFLFFERKKYHYA